MVGREPELAELLEAARAAEAGEVTLALVTGEAGMSRLIDEMRAQLDGIALFAVGHGMELETGELTSATRPSKPFIRPTSGLPRTSPRRRPARHRSRTTRRH